MRALLSATFYERGESHVIEKVHQAGHRELASLSLSCYDGPGQRLGTIELGSRNETVDLAELADIVPMCPRRLMVTFDARYDERQWPYRPHHYGLRRSRKGPPLYYAVNAVLGGVPDTIGATTVNNVERFTFPPEHHGQEYALLLGSLSRYVATDVYVAKIYGHGAAVARQMLTLKPYAHREVPVESSHHDLTLTSVGILSVSRIAAYIVGRRPSDRALMLYDHLFTDAR